MVSVPQLAGHFDTEFWTSQLLKMCHSEPGVWHSLLALGALHEDFIGSHRTSRDASWGTRRIALGHYNQAIRVLTQTKRLDVILVSCFMFILMEVLLGNIEGAINQLHSGTRIFKARRAEIARKGLKPDSRDKFIEDHILGPFHHLNLYSHIWGRPPARTSLTPDPLIEDSCPRVYEFESLVQARASLLDDIISGGGTSGLQEWEGAFNRFLVQRRTAFSNPREKLSIAIIQLQLNWASICVPNLEETKYDAFVRLFEMGLNIADSQIRANSSGIAPNDLSPAFSLTLQNFLTIYLTAIKCRNPALRRRALALLKSPPNHTSHGSIWNTSTAIKLIERVIEIEEDGLEDLTDMTGSVVPSEWSRIQYIEKVPDVGQGNSTSLFRFRRQVDGQWQHFLERF